MARSTGDPAKSIVLFSDGTGNSSAKLFKTNVWRMYEAVDLGPSPTGERDQISFYDDGVGTSNFKFLAAIGGAFGWGLKRNVLDLYCYACRNYREGDQIYGFGFSRGAFTMRVVVALIASEGLVRSTDESELNRKSICAYRAFRKKFKPRKFAGITEFGRRLRDKWVARGERRRKLKPYNRKDNRPADIRFVGVWDTVAAYGGPIAEITRAIDNWFFPLSMPDYELDERVQCARHALALDDERDAFQPLLWDELAEDRRADDAKRKKQAALDKARRARSEQKRRALRKEASEQAKRERHFRERMQQVWFTGMHADVGGGYPDESLSYVSLLWMMEEAEKAGLRTLDAIKIRFIALANSYGPMHNSRSGFGAYYRYQPRKIAAWLDPPNDRYLMLRDPDIQDSKGREHGLLRCVCVHESVIARIDTGTVRYAPIALPRDFEIIPPQAEGETLVQAHSDSGEMAVQGLGSDAAAQKPSEPLIHPDLRTRLKKAAAGRFACQENLWDLVWRRRLAYFATVTITLLLVALPFWNPLPSFVDQLCSDSRCVLPSLIRPLKALVPGFAEPWISAIARYPVTAIAFVLAIILLLQWSGRIEARLWDGSYRLWRRALDGDSINPRKCPESKLRAYREGWFYQKFFRDLKWHTLPTFSGLGMLAVILYVPLVGITQLAIQVNEADHYFCKPDDLSKLRRVEHARFDFDTANPCVTPNLALEKGQVYEVVFQLPVSAKGEPVGWWDDTVGSKPGSLTRVRASGFFQVLGVPMRRVIEASYLQPIVQTARMSNAGNRLERVRISKLALVQDEEWPELYRVRFRASADSRLHLFANDAYLPFVGTRLYKNNCGVARVDIIKIVRGEKKLMTEPGKPVEVPKCAYAPGRLDEANGSETVSAAA
jgi:uncharacterized protein (DUF2235 family)